MSSGKALTAEMLADALGCFWNAAIGDARDKQDSRVLAVASSMAEGFAAVERRLREHAQPAPTSEVDGEKLGRFGWHPDPATDFELEVGDIEAEIYHQKVGFENGTPPLTELVARINRAMSFRVGAVETCVLAKHRLRELEKEAAALAQVVPATMGGAGEMVECHKSDTPERVCFYEQDFYVLSNFSSFSIMWEKSPRVGLIRFDTSEAVYHWMKFKPNIPTAEQYHLMEQIRYAPSAHEAFKIAERNKHLRRPDWDDVKVDVMRDILRAKVDQHEYVKRKLLATGDRELVEDSWRDDFWGWGPNRDGKNMLGRLWMEIRAELRAALAGNPSLPSGGEKSS
ncbi:NADAR family protein [Mesorhizobium sp. M0520]|uniref:NADAR family protein n=1 Tax=Mesorhizobium sp. M0520 TaxID=2956957 RepID=UPI00333CFB7A